MRWVRGGGDVGGHQMVATPQRSTLASQMDPKEGDYVRFKQKRVETTGTVIKRSGAHNDGGATLWKELSELLPLAPAVDEAYEVAEPQRLFSSGPSSARANALNAPGVQEAAKQTVSERPNKIGMPTPMPSSPAQENAYLDDGDDTNLDGIDDAVAVAAKSAGEQLAGMMRVRGGMGAGASALTGESPDADIKAAYAAASAQERSEFLIEVGEQKR